MVETQKKYFFKINNLKKNTVEVYFFDREVNNWKKAACNILKKEFTEFKIADLYEINSQSLTSGSSDTTEDFKFDAFFVEHENSEKESEEKAISEDIVYRVPLKVAEEKEIQTAIEIFKMRNFHHLIQSKSTEQQDVEILESIQKGSDPVPSFLSLVESDNTDRVKDLLEKIINSNSVSGLRTIFLKFEESLTSFKEVCKDNELYNWNKLWNLLGYKKHYYSEALINKTYALILHSVVQYNPPKEGVNKGLEIVNMFLDAGADPKFADQKGRTLLHVAAEHGHANLVEKILALGLQPDVRDQNGSTPLHGAAEKGHLGIVETLLKAGADPELADQKGRTLLHVAAEHGHANLVEKFLALGLQPDLLDQDGCTPLSVAVKHGHEEVVKKLIHNLIHNMDASLRSTDENWYTPLHWAVEKGHLNIVELLLEAGADPNLVDKNEYTPLSLAVLHQKKEMVEKFLGNGAIPISISNLIDKRGYSALRIAIRIGNEEIFNLLVEAVKKEFDLIKEEKEEEKKDMMQSLALCLLEAVAWGRVENVKKLIELNISPIGYCDIKYDGEKDTYQNIEMFPEHILNIIKENNIKFKHVFLTGFWCNPLSLAIIAGEDEIFNIFIEKLKYDLLFYNSEYWFYAVKSQHDKKQKFFLRLMKKLIEEKSYFDFFRKKENTDFFTGSRLTKVLFFAIQNNEPVIVQSLLEVATDIHEVNENGRTPLEEAIFHGYAGIAQILIDADPSHSRVDKERCASLLLNAATKGHTDLLPILIGMGANLETVDENGCTPLMMAAKQGHTQFVETLLKNGVDLKTRALDGNTAFTYALNHKHQKTANIIKAKVKERFPVVEQLDMENVFEYAVSEKNHVAEIKHVFLTKKYTLDNLLDLLNGISPWLATLSYKPMTSQAFTSDWRKQWGFFLANAGGNSKRMTHILDTLITAWAMKKAEQNELPFSYQTVAEWKKIIFEAAAKKGYLSVMQDLRVLGISSTFQAVVEQNIEDKSGDQDRLLPGNRDGERSDNKKPDEKDSALDVQGDSGVRNIRTPLRSSILQSDHKKPQDEKQAQPPVPVQANRHDAWWKNITYKNMAACFVIANTLSMHAVSCVNLYPQLMATGSLLMIAKVFVTTWWTPGFLLTAMAVVGLLMLEFYKRVTAYQAQDHVKRTESQRVENAYQMSPR